MQKFLFLRKFNFGAWKKYVHPKLFNFMARLVQCITYIVCIYLVHYKGNFSGDLHNNANPDKNTPIKVCVRVLVQWFRNFHSVFYAFYHKKLFKKGVYNKAHTFENISDHCILERIVFFSVFYKGNICHKNIYFGIISIWE